MSTGRPQRIQLPLCPRKLLIADVTRLQPFIVGGDSFRENIETLISYNVRNDGAQQDSNSCSVRCTLHLARSFCTPWKNRIRVFP